jgi:hypothetical protein
MDNSLSKKAFEVSYALFRIAGSLQSRRNFAEHLENAALSLLESAVSGNTTAARSSVKVVEYLIRIGGEVNIINQANSDILIRELSIINSVIDGLSSSAPVPNISIVDIFSKEQEPGVEKLVDSIEPPVKEVIGRPVFTEKVQVQHSSEPVAAVVRQEPQHINKKEQPAADRQAAIFGKIRQSGNCRLKEVQEILPDTSERTLRYDLQELVERGLVERIGSSGPATYYRLPLVAE